MIAYISCIKKPFPRWARGKEQRMANRLPPAEETSFAMQLKNLADEELLDFWTETQQLESVFRSEYQQPFIPVQDYERMIVLELQLRACRREKTCGV